MSLTCGFVVEGHPPVVGLARVLSRVRPNNRRPSGGPLPSCAHWTRGARHRVGGHRAATARPARQPPSRLPPTPGSGPGLLRCPGRPPGHRMLVGGRREALRPQGVRYHRARPTRPVASSRDLRPDRGHGHRGLRPGRRARLHRLSVDGSLHKSPCGGPGTGPNPTDRAKLGWKWSIIVDAAGVPVGWHADGANRHDSVMLEATLDDLGGRAMLVDIETIWLDRGYDSDVSRAASPPGASPTRSSPASAVEASQQPLRRRHGSGCAGRSNGPTVGCRTTASSDATPTADPPTASHSSPSPSPSCSPPSSSTGETPGHRHRHLSAEPLKDIATLVRPVT